jgi:putative Mn2+ efflux pump MntP
MLEQVLLALVMGIDAFTLALGVGCRGVSIKWMLLLSLLVGLFHAIMPLLGIVVGHWVGHALGHASLYVGGSVFILLGANMLYQVWASETHRVRNPFTSLGAILFAFGVSIDSFSAGLSLGLFAVQLVTAVLIFGIVGSIATLSGFLLGRRLAGWFGTYAELLGGALLIGWGLRVVL